MSKRNILTKPKVLIDTTFLLPPLGIEVENEAMNAIKFFRKIDVYYIEYGILEAIWKILKIIPTEQLNIINEGLSAIRNTYKKVEVPVEAYLESILIYNKGHNDFIDAIYFSTAKVLRIPWLTIDKNFIEFLKKNNYDIDGLIYTPKELKEIIEKS